MSFIELGKDKKLRGAPTSVLLYLLGVLDCENNIIVSQVDIADKLEMIPNKVSAAIKVLLDKSIIEKGPKSGCSWTYRFNKKYVWEERGKIRIRLTFK